MTEDYPLQESKTLEFKSDLPSFPTLLKTAVAFANGVGGKIIFGVDDKTKKLVGVSEKTKKALYKQFLDCLYDSTQPAILGRIFEQNLNENTVLILEIPSVSKKPCYLKKEGIPKGVFLRVGSHTRQATQEAIEDLTRETMRISYDEELIKKPITLLEPSLLQPLFGKHPSEKALLAEQVIGKFSTNHETVHPTRAGVLFFSEEPERYIPEAVVLCTEFKGTAGREIITSRELKGPIPRLFNETIQLLKALLARGYSLRGAHLQGELPVPEVAIREALSNALLHRKYSIPGAIKVAIWDDRLEIFSPGGFPGLVDVSTLGDGITYLRNPILARLGHKLGLMERLGTGIRLMFESCEKEGMQKPVFNEEGDFVKVIFYFNRPIDPSLPDDEKIIALIRGRFEVHSHDVAKILGISRNTASRKLGALVKQGVLVKLGAGPKTRYVLKT